MGESQREDKNSRDLTKKEDGIIETSLPAPFPFDYIEKQLRKKVGRIQSEWSMRWRRQARRFAYI
jgi:hypothetical protein